MQKLSKCIGVLCLIAGGLQAAAISIAPTGISVAVTANLKTPLLNGVLLYNTTDVNGVTSFNSVSLPSVVPANISVPTSFNVNVPAGFSSGVATIVGAYQSGLGIAVNSGLYSSILANPALVPFNGVFPTPVSEPALIAAVQTKNTATLQSFFNANSASFVPFNLNTTNLQAGVLLFSNAQDGGTFTINSVTATAGPAPSGVPEPGTWLLAGLGMAGVAGWRKFRRATA